MAAVDIEQQIATTLKHVDIDAKALARGLAKANSGLSAGEKSKLHEELEPLSKGLLEHRSQIRKWATQLSPKSKCKEKLGGARARIEQEVRRFDEFAKGLVSKQPQAEETARAADSRTSSTFSDADGSAEASVEAAATEAKVWSIQVTGDAEELEMAEELICKICQVHVVGAGPKLTKCSHLFCGDCLAKWFEVNPGNKSWAQRAQAGKSVPCPVCKEPLLQDRDLHDVSAACKGGSALLWRMLCGTKLICGNNFKCFSAGRCDWTGDYGSYQDHLRACKNAPIMPEAPAPPPSPALELQPVSLPDALPASPPGSAPTSPTLAPSDSDSTDVPSHSDSFEPCEASGDEGSIGMKVHEEAAPMGSGASLAELITALAELKLKERLKADAATPPPNSEEPSLLPPPSASLPVHDAVSQKTTCKTQKKATNTMKKVQHNQCEITEQLRAAQVEVWQLQVSHAAQAAQWETAQWQAAQYQVAQFQAAQLQAAAQQRAVQAAQWHAARAVWDHK